MNLQEFQKYQQDTAAWEQQRQRIREAVAANLSQTVATDAQATGPHGTFAAIALPLIAKNVPCTVVRPNSKVALLSDWPTSATTDKQQILAWDAQYPNHNGAAVATGKPDGVWFMEVDSIDVRKRIEAETGQQIPETFVVRSRPGRGHYYWKQTPASLAMGNISQSFVKNGDWSARVENQYVIAPRSIHPTSQQPYEALNDAEIVPAPDWLVAWCISQKIGGEKKSSDAKLAEIPRDERNLIPHGHIHGFLLTHAGKLRNQGLSVDLIEKALLEIAHTQCAPPIDDSKVIQVAHSMAPYEQGKSTDLILNLKPPVEPVKLPHLEYPKFPKYVMEGTSIYENFVKPICEKNGRIDYFMWLPAMAMLINYVGPKVKLGNLGPFIGNLYLLLIGRKSKAMKSSSIDDVMTFFTFASLLQQGTADVKNAEGRMLAYSPGSSEGLGQDMQRTNCKNAVLHYDELSRLVSKAGIENSAFYSDLLTIYEGKLFTNNTKDTKKRFTIESGTYALTVIAATTDKKFHELWARMVGEDTGMDDRWMFVLQPEVLPERKLKCAVPVDKTEETRRRIDKAVQRGRLVCDHSDNSLLMDFMEISDNRMVDRAMRWAAGIAVDLGFDEIDDDCIERGIDIVKYELAVKAFLKPETGLTREAIIQQKIKRLLVEAGGSMTKFALEHKGNYTYYGTSLWNSAYFGLVKNNLIREEPGERADSVRVVLLRLDSEENE